MGDSAPLVCLGAIIGLRTSYLSFQKPETLSCRGEGSSCPTVIVMMLLAMPMGVGIP